MDSKTVFDYIEDLAIVAGMRGNFPPEIALNVVDVLVDEDIDVFEFTMNSVQPIEAMQAVKKKYGDDVAAGMGTVLDLETAQRVLDAGADFIVSPAFQPEIVEYVLKADKLIAPGVITPSEAVAAWSLGVPLLKLFPVGTLGVDYFKAFFGPLNHMKFMCNGGMTADNAQGFLQAGAMAVGMSSWLSGDGTWPESRLRSRAQVLRNAVAIALPDHNAEAETKK
jgi:2-dehydro-3-deoxyphosphogluconate aldolase / (4S)-4-hydroxy-2-oxoglutarate aldolase